MTSLGKYVRLLRLKWLDHFYRNVEEILRATSYFQLQGKRGRDKQMQCAQ